MYEISIKSSSIDLDIIQFTKLLNIAVEQEDLPTIEFYKKLIKKLQIISQIYKYLEQEKII